ncbi:MAG: NADH-quinone oxidoreductase subunit C [Microthrixaceae bacterium]
MDDGAADATAEDAPVSEPDLAHGVPVSSSGGQVVLHPSREEYADLVARLRGEGYWVCLDLCGVDYLTYDPPRDLPAGIEPQRFEVVAELVDPTQRQRLRIRVQVPAEDPTVASIVAVHPGVDAHEREVFDLFGIDFEGHPHLTRILLPDEWVGHPLRKDEPVGSIPVQFKATREEQR